VSHIKDSNRQRLYNTARMEKSPHPDERSASLAGAMAHMNMTKVLTALPGNGWTEKRLVETGHPRTTKP